MSLSFLRKAFIGYAVVLVIAVFCDALRYGWIAMINIPEYIENAVGLGGKNFAIRCTVSQKIRKLTKKKGKLINET